MKTAVLRTSIDAYRGMPVNKKATQADNIMTIVNRFHRARPNDDLSISEIQLLYIRDYGGNIQNGTVSARLNELIAAGRLVRMDTIRRCRVHKGHGIYPVRLPAEKH